VSRVAEEPRNLGLAKHETEVGFYPASYLTWDAVYAVRIDIDRNRIPAASKASEIFWALGTDASGKYKAVIPGTNEDFFNYRTARIVQTHVDRDDRPVHVFALKTGELERMVGFNTKRIIRMDPVFAHSLNNYAIIEEANLTAVFAQMRNERGGNDDPHRLYARAMHETIGTRHLVVRNVAAIMSPDVAVPVKLQLVGELQTLQGRLLKRELPQSRALGESLRDDVLGPLVGFRGTGFEAANRICQGMPPLLAQQYRQQIQIFPNPSQPMPFQQAAADASAGSWAPAPGGG